MNPGVFVMGGGGGGGGRGSGSGSGAGRDQGANGANGGEGAGGGGRGACGGVGGTTRGCPNHHRSNSGRVTRGDPVDALTGRVFEGPLRDAWIRGRLGIAFERSYSSASTERDVGLGYGWSHSFAWEVEERRRSTIVWNDVGMPLAFDALLRPGDVGLGPDGLLLVRTDFGFVLDEPGRRKLVFERRCKQAWLVTSIRDLQGNMTRLRYDDRDQLVEIVDAAGRSIRLVRGSDGRISSLQAKNAAEQGRWVRLQRYEYNEAGDLTAAVDAEGCAMSYEYREHRLIRKVDPEGFEFFYVYDAAGRCVETWGTHADERRLGLASTVPSVLADGTPARGMYHCRTAFYPDHYVESTDSVSVQRYFGNDFGKCDKAVSGGSVYTRTFDERGHLLSFTDPNAATTTWTRDARGWPLRIVDPLGRVTTFERDPDGSLRSIVDPEGGVTTIERGAGWLRWTDPIGALFEVRMDARGNVTEAIAPNGARTAFTYDQYGNLVRKTNALGQTVEWTYDYWGRLIAQRDPRGCTEWYSYNDRGDLLSVTTATGATHRYSYDRNGALVAVYYPTGTWLQMDVGIGGKLLAVRRPNGDHRALRYDREGRLVEGVNARGERYSFTYDTAGRIVREKTFTGVEKWFRYDPAGQLIEERWSTGDRVEYVYDAAGQLVERSTDEYAETFEYDLCGRLIACEGPWGRFEYIRNAAGWVTEERHRWRDASTSIRTRYDVMGHVSRRETSLGHTVDFERDPCGRALRLVLDKVEEVKLAYDPSGREVERCLPGGGRITTTYDANGRLAQRLVVAEQRGGIVGPQPGWVGARPPGTTVFLAHQYDADGRLAEVWDDRTGRRAYQRDGAGWLLEVAEAGGRAERYSYDALGNVVGDRGRDRRYGRGNMLLADGEKTFQWDDAGRLLSVSDGAGKTTRYRWDGLGRLAAVERADGRIVRFTYDAFDRRIEKRVTARAPLGEIEVATHRYVWSGGEIVHELRRVTQEDGSLNVDARTFCYDEISFRPFAQREAGPGPRGGEGSWYHFVTDNVGCPQYLVDRDGRVATAFERTAFGEVRATEGGPSTPFRFAGQWADEETGLVYNRHRYYDPSIGRYISADPAGLGAGFNGFDYADNAPDEFVDPYGLMPFSVIRNPGGTPSSAGDRTDPRARRGELPPLGGNARARDREEIPAHQREGNIVGRAQGDRNNFQEAQRANYRDDAITEAVRNAQRARGETPTGDTTCAEVDALHQMAHRIRNDPDFRERTRRMSDEERNIEVRRELQRRFREGATIETTNAAGEGMAPCPMCAQIFRELGIHPANIGDGARGGVIGPNDRSETNVRRMGRWDGSICQPSEARSSRTRAGGTSPSRTPPFSGR